MSLITGAIAFISPRPDSLVGRAQRPRQRSTRVEAPLVDDAGDIAPHRPAR
jgi:hypothetical protein